jgi:hypothetical protein
MSVLKRINDNIISYHSKAEADFGLLEANATSFHALQNVHSK